MKKNLKLYKLEEASEHSTPSPRIEYVPLHLEEDKESDVLPTKSVPLDDPSDTQLDCNKHFSSSFCHRREIFYMCSAKL